MKAKKGDVFTAGGVAKTFKVTKEADSDGFVELTEVLDTPDSPKPKAEVVRTQERNLTDTEANEWRGVEAA
jgi:hypothetical protein